MKRNCSGDRERLLKFEAKGQEFSKFLFTVGQNNLGNKIPFSHLIVCTANNFI